MMKKTSIAVVLLLIPGVANAQTVGSFDASRAGRLAFADTTTVFSFFDQAQASLATNFGVSFATTPTITAAFLTTVDVFVVAAAKDCCSGITALTASEQEALFDFVRNGGSALVMADNDTFAQAATPAILASLLSPFGLAASGTIGATIFSTVPDPSLSPITSCPFGTVNSIKEIVPGAFTDLGFATSLAFNALGPSLAVLNPGDTIPSGEILGRVVLSTEGGLFIDDNAFARPLFTPNETLFLNTFAFLLPVCELFTATAFEPPMGKKKKIASTLPIKFRLFFDGVEIVSEEQLNQIQADNGCTLSCPKPVFFLQDGMMELPIDDQPDDNVGDPDEGDCFRYSAPNWIYNLRLLPPAFMPDKCYTVEIEIGVDCVLVPDNNAFETK